MKEDTHRLRRMFSTFLLVVTAIFVVLLAQLVLGVRSELGEIRTELSALRKEAAPPMVAEPTRVLEQRCVRCHSERRFMGVHGSAFELKQIVEKMEALPDVKISPQESEKIHASLELLKCVRCHEEERLKKLGALTPERRRELIREMAEKPGSEISPEESEGILRAYQKIQGF